MVTKAKMTGETPEVSSDKRQRKRKRRKRVKRRKRRKRRQGRQIMENHGFSWNIVEHNESS